jgi:hypothetical protein
MAMDLEIVLKARDEATKLIEGLGAGIVGMAAAFGIATKANQIFDKVLGAIKETYAEAIKEALEYYEVHARLEGVLLSTGKAAQFGGSGIDEMNVELAKNTVSTGHALEGAEALALSFDSVSRENLPRLMMASAGLAKLMGGDLSAATAKLGRALEDPAASLNLLRRSFIVLSGETKEHIKNLQESGRFEEAQSALLDAVEKKVSAVNSSYRDSPIGEYTEQINKLKEAQEKLGIALMPVEQFFVSIKSELYADIAGIAKFLTSTDEPIKQSTDNLKDMIKETGNVQTALQTLFKGKAAMAPIPKRELTESEIEAQKKAAAEAAKNEEENLKIRSEINTRYIKIGKKQHEDFVKWEDDSLKLKDKEQDEIRLAQVTLRNQLRTEGKTGLALQLSDLKQHYREEQKAAAGNAFLLAQIDKNYAKSKTDVMNQAYGETINVVASSFATIASQYKQFSGIAKGAAYAETVWNTSRAIMAVWASYSTLGPIGTAMAAIQTAALAAAGAVNLSKISAQSFQTFPGQTRTVPGPYGMPMNAIVHGGEQIGRSISNSTTNNASHIYVIQDRSGNITKDLMDSARSKSFNVKRFLEFGGIKT